MDPAFKFPAASASAQPLQPISPDRVNQQRQSLYDEYSPANSIRGHSRPSSVHEKVAAFNTLGSQAKILERKANDAALKRAMVGREEAETEMWRYREDVKRYKEDVEVLKRHIDEGKAREKKVCARLEDVMEKYGRAKETHEHTQAVWEKEIRRARKENFKSQSAYVKVQEELKSSREIEKKAHAELKQEKERSAKREQEAFEARYQLVGVQNELVQMQEQIKLVEQERDALRTIAKNEEIARIAAEGQIPLPRSQEDDEFASPKKVRKSLDPVTITSSAASEEELDDMRMLLEWEQQRANRAHDRVEFLEAECRLNCCISRASRRSTSVPPAAQIGRSSTVYIPAEGIFRTVSPAPEESPWISPAKKTLPPILPEQSYQATPSQARQQNNVSQDLPSYARTPSCEPPAPAMMTEANTSLLSLLDAPHSPSRTNDETESVTDENPTPTQARIFHNPGSSTAPSPAPEYTFHTISHTTRIPLANPPDLTPPTVLPLASNPALSPTMTREEALAQIRERRGRARSLAQGTLTPRKQMVEGKERRDISAPAIRSGNIRGRMASRT